MYELLSITVVSKSDTVNYESIFFEGLASSTDIAELFPGIMYVCVYFCREGCIVTVVSSFSV